LCADTGLVRAEAAFSEAKLADAPGNLYASATSTLFIFDRVGPLKDGGSTKLALPAAW
jgi:hypothetical protein